MIGNSQTSIEWKYRGAGPSPASMRVQTLLDRSIAHMSLVSCLLCFPPKRKMVGGCGDGKGEMVMDGPCCQPKSSTAHRHLVSTWSHGQDTLNSPSRYPDWNHRDYEGLTVRGGGTSPLVNSVQLIKCARLESILINWSSVGCVDTKRHFKHLCNA